ncbi:MAG TPA: glycosyltransferase [Phycisphaerae bacterium]
MPTFNRRAFVPRAIAYFQRQDYPNKELVIVDDGTEEARDLIPADARIRYVRLERRASVGAKRNMACEQSSSPLIAHWDDDDWHARHRLSYQVEELLKCGADICGLKTLLFLASRDGRGWQYNYPEGQREWLSGNSLLYRRQFWAAHRFPEINVGEDSRFVWSAAAGQLVALADSTIHVGIIHTSNVSPKHVGGAWWQPHPAEEIRRVMGEDWETIMPEREVLIMEGDRGNESGGRMPEVILPVGQEERAEVKPVRNIFACLVHENPDCIIDLVRNLKCLDPTSVVLLYNGSADGRLLDAAALGRQGAEIHPAPTPMAWGKLHDFALECMRYSLERFAFDTMTIVDSDQLALRSGYSERLARALEAQPGAGMLGNAPGVQLSSTTIGPAKAAFAEIELWRPLLRRFADGERKLFHWTFWPTTVFTAAAARDLTRFFSEDEQLRQILARSKIWATEEVILPTMTALLGHGIGQNPCRDDYVKYRSHYTPKQLEGAMEQGDIFWAHPVPRRYNDPLRKLIRDHHHKYVEPTAKPVAARGPSRGQRPLLLSQPILAQMRQIEGWLEDDEADLLIAATARALAEVPGAAAIAEVGSYCGRATVVLAQVVKAVRPAAKVWTIDTHDGVIGTAQEPVRVAPSLHKLRHNLGVTGSGEVVEVLQGRVEQLGWNQPVAFVLIDGLHDYLNVSADFLHLEPWLAEGGMAAFHDYADYYPGVMMFVDELVAEGRYTLVHRAGSMVILQKLACEKEGAEEKNVIGVIATVPKGAAVEAGG